MEQLKNVAEGLLEVETLDNSQFVQLFDGEKTPQQLGEDLRAELEAKKEKDEAEAAESAKLRKRQAELEKKRMEEAAKLLEAQGKKGKFKPTIMTYNDITKKAEPLDLGKLAEDDEEVKPSQADGSEPSDDDDMPSEEELAVYDTDYLNDDSEDTDSDTDNSEAETGDADDNSSDDEKEKRNE